MNTRFAALRAAPHTRFAALRAAPHTRFAALRAAPHTRFAALRAAPHTRFAALRAAPHTFDERAVLQELAQAAGQGARVDLIRGRADRFDRRDDVHRLRDGAMTTENLIDCERRLIGAAAGRAEEGCAVVSASAIDRAVSGAPRPLTREQEVVVRQCASSGHGLDVVEARAGTGKTYTAGVLRSLCEGAGYRVRRVICDRWVARDPPLTR
jgi:AAA domain